MAADRLSAFRVHGGRPGEAAPVRLTADIRWGGQVGDERESNKEVLSDGHLSLGRRADTVVIDDRRTARSGGVKLSRY